VSGVGEMSGGPRGVAGGRVRMLLGDDDRMVALGHPRGVGWAIRQGHGERELPQSYRVGLVLRYACGPHYTADAWVHEVQ
jgi:hypothetical protein